MEYTYFDLIGNIGVTLIIGSYFFLQIGRLKAEQLSYSLVNLLGATLVIVSLAVNFNFSAFIIEVFWILISLVGLIRNVFGVHKQPK